MDRPQLSSQFLAGSNDSIYIDQYDIKLFEINRARMLYIGR